MCLCMTNANQKHKTAILCLRFACVARLLSLLLLTLPALVQAQDYTYTTNDGAITITKYIGSGGAVSIPDTIDGPAGHQHRGFRVL